MGQRTWKRNALCSNGVPCRSRIRNRTSPSSEASITSLRRAKETRAALTTERSLAMASSSRTKPWSRTGIVWSGITASITATAATVPGGPVGSRRGFRHSRGVAAYVGSSGWSYPEWRGSFYPADAQPPDFLRLYAERLNAVELNATFYRLPSEAQLEAWAAQTPAGFRFAVKLSRHIAHGGRLDRLATFCERVRALGDRLGPVLVELPDDRPRDDGFLHLLLDSLPDGIDLAIEPKHPSWADAEIPVRVGALEADPPFAYLRLREH